MALWKDRACRGYKEFGIAKWKSHRDACAAAGFLFFFWFCFPPFLSTGTAESQADCLTQPVRYHVLSHSFNLPRDEKRDSGAFPPLPRSVALQTWGAEARWPVNQNTMY